MLRTAAPTAGPVSPGGGPFTVATRVVPDPERLPAEAVEAAADIAARDAGTGGLPVVDLPAAGPARALALVVSGDGGWRDIDKSIGERLTRDGVHVAGLDALRYFWRERDPRAMAADYTAILRTADPGGRLPILVLGYSFGADLFPFAWPFLPGDLRERVRLIALLAPGRSTGFTVSVKGWLGYGGAHAVVPRIADLPLDRVLCIHGTSEPDSACLDPSLEAARKVLLEGGHHFDRDYPAIAARILSEAGLPERDAGLTPAPPGTP